jgi:hypothetical protein
MELPEYVTREEVQRVCQELGFRDWTELTSTEVTDEEARALQELVGAEAAEISTQAFKQGMEVELEHGIEFTDANVTNNHPVLTAKIVLAHLKEMLDYYERLEVAELEGDLLGAVAAGDQARASAKYQQLIDARQALAQAERARFTH